MKRDSLVIWISTEMTSVHHRSHTFCALKRPGLSQLLWKLRRRRLCNHLLCARANKQRHSDRIEYNCNKDMVGQLSSEKNAMIAFADIPSQCPSNVYFTPHRFGKTESKQRNPMCVGCSWGRHVGGVVVFLWKDGLTPTTNNDHPHINCGENNDDVPMILSMTVVPPLMFAHSGRWWSSRISRKRRWDVMLVL